MLKHLRIKQRTKAMGATCDDKGIEKERAIDCSCSLCYLREHGWHKWYAKYRTVWRLELNAHPIERLGDLDWVWLNGSNCPFSFEELERDYQSRL